MPSRRFTAASDDSLTSVLITFNSLKRILLQFINYLIKNSIYQNKVKYYGYVARTRYTRMWHSSELWMCNVLLSPITDRIPVNISKLTSKYWLRATLDSTNALENEAVPIIIAFNQRSSETEPESRKEIATYHVMWSSRFRKPMSSLHITPPIKLYRN